MTAPDPGLTDLIAAEIARHRLRYGSEDAYNGERWLCTTCPWLVEADTGSRPNATVIQAHANHVAERLKLVVEQHTNGRIAELEAELEKQKRGGRTLGKAIDRTLKWVIEASNSEDLIGDDGDGDWEIVWDRLFQLRPNLEAAIDRADKAEAAIAKVRAVEAEYLDPEDTDIECREDVWRFIRDLRAALEGEQQ